TRAVLEGTRARNMDRGVNYGIALPSPVAPGDKDEMSGSFRFEQDLARMFTLGVGLDYYTPDLAQAKDGRFTTRVVGAITPTKGLRLALEYDLAVDNIHTPDLPARAKEIQMFSSVLQARF